jgi:multicomponent Na+:H+ antiporter subunit D
VSFALKAGVFPLYFWLPSSYHTPPPAVAAIFAGLLTKVGVYALIRVFGMVLPPSVWQMEMLLVLAGATMLLGVLGAVSQMDVRRVLSFHILSQIGYMVVAFGLLVSPDAQTRKWGLTAAVLYITHHIIVKTNLFLVGGLIRDLTGSFDLHRQGGLARSAPWLAVLFLVPAASLAGLPPLSGFWAKLGVLEATLDAGRGLLAAIAVVAGLLTLLSMLKIWNHAFWRPAADPDARPGRAAWSSIAPVALLAGCTLIIGLVPQPFVAAAERAASQILDVQAYAEAVLGSTSPRVAEGVEP